MNGEYQWWLLAVVGAATLGVFWLLRGTLPRREVDVEEPEVAAEARWISRRLHEVGASTPAETVEKILELHRRYLEEPPAGAPLETVFMPLPDEEEASSAEDASEPEQRRLSRRERGRASRQLSGQAELPTAHYRESGSGG